MADPRINLSIKVTSDLLEKLTYPKKASELEPGDVMYLGSGISAKVSRTYGSPDYFDGQVRVETEELKYLLLISDNFEVRVLK